MAFDAPDYFNRTSEYRRGFERSYVIFKDDFEDTKLKWFKNIYGTLARSLDEAKSGEASMLLTTPANSSQNVAASIRIGSLIKGLTGIDFYFVFLATNHITFEILWQQRETAYLQEADIRYLSASSKWQYYDYVLDAFVDIPNGTQKLRRDVVIWNHLKFMVDSAAESYISLECGTLFLPLYTIPAYGAATDDYDYMLLVIRVTPATNTAEKVYIDDLIVYGFEE